MIILTYPNDILRQESKAVEKVTPELQQLARDMYQTMKENNGIGLAAPQIGQLIRLIVIDNDGEPLYMFNPHIMERSGNKIPFNEGCLSFPNEFKVIKRADNIKIKYRDINNKMKFGQYSGLVARIILHEIDHLFGVLLIDHEDNGKEQE